MRTKVDPEIVKLNKQITAAVEMMRVINTELEQAVGKDSKAFMQALARYSASTDEALPDPLESTQKVAKQCIDVYRLLARSVAVIEPCSDKVVFFMTKPRLEVRNAARMCYSLGKAYAYLGVCWEDIKAPEAVQPHLADNFMRSLLAAMENVNFAYQYLKDNALVEDL